MSLREEKYRMSPALYDPTPQILRSKHIQPLFTDWLIHKIQQPYPVDILHRQRVSFLQKDQTRKLNFQSFANDRKRDFSSLSELKSNNYKCVLEYMFSSLSLKHTGRCCLYLKKALLPSFPESLVVPRSTLAGLQGEEGGAIMSEVNLTEMFDLLSSPRASLHRRAPLCLPSLLPGYVRPAYVSFNTLLLVSGVSNFFASGPKRFDKISNKEARLFPRSMSSQWHAAV